jgi:hypothetical protein
MTSLELELLRRNARLRAWRAYGVPVEGGWQLDLPGTTPRALWCDLKLGCGVCNRRGQSQSVNALGRHAEGLLTALAAAERQALSRWWRSGWVAVCSHLAPLLGVDPPEVLAILELELLGGE